MIVTPAGPPPWPALIIIHPVTGLEEMMQQRARDYARAGYLAVAPDVYAGDPAYGDHEPKNIERAAHLWLERDDAKREASLARFDPAVRKRIFAAHEWIIGRNTASFVDVVAACFAEIRGRSDVTTIGCIGYCMGGRLSGELAASGAALDAAVIFYGPAPKAETIPKIRCPIQGHYAVTDSGITSRVYEFALAMHAAGKSFDYSVYDADHGFGEPVADVYDPAAARLATGRADAFLAQHLKRLE
jgi:carboxymethylenebutenolidase